MFRSYQSLVSRVFSFFPDGELLAKMSVAFEAVIAWHNNRLRNEAEEWGRSTDLENRRATTLDW